MTIAYFTRSLPKELYNKVDNTVVDKVNGLAIGNIKLGSIFQWQAFAVRAVFEFITNRFGRRSPSTVRTAANSNDSLPNYSVSDEESEERKRAAMTSFMLSLSDQQLLTGFAVLISFLPNRCQISYVSFGIAIQLAWASCLTHAATLIFLRGYLEENVRIRRLRYVLVGTLLCFILAILIYFYIAFPAAPSSQTLFLCSSFGGSVDAFRLFGVLVSFCFTTINCVQELTARWMPSKFDESGGAISTPLVYQEYWKQRPPYNMTMTSRVWRRLHFLTLVDQYSSSLWSQLLDIQLTAVYQTAVIIKVTVPHHSSEWGFGQIMPMILLGLPALSAFEGYLGALS
jgi:hypothetical protein